MPLKSGDDPLASKLLLKDSRIQKTLIYAITVVIAFVIVLNGAMPKKYKLVLGEKSPYDITAPRDIINQAKVEEKAKAAEEAIRAVIKEDDTALFDMFMGIDSFTSAISATINDMKKDIEQSGLAKETPEYEQKLEASKNTAINKLLDYCKSISMPISRDQGEAMISNIDDNDISAFKSKLMDVINDTVRKGITEDNIQTRLNEIHNELINSNIDESFKTISRNFVKAILRPIKTIDNDLTALKKKEAYKQAYDEAQKIEKVLKGERIISFGDIVTQDKLDMLDELNLLEAKKRLDFGFTFGILALIIMLSVVVYIYMKHFCTKILRESKNLILLSVIILTVLLVARIFAGSMPPLTIPVFLAVMLISVLFEYKAGIIINLVLTILISIMIKGDVQFLYMSIISGTLSAFIVSNINQRSRMSLAGFIIGGINSIIITCTGMLYKNSFDVIITNAGMVFLNGFVSIILTIGLLPLLEMLFGVITPLKLLELANPNQPLIKRLLMEAPGTYHHSLMVGNLAEVALESIGGDAILARVGAYYHDVGKLVRPYFFKENQLSDNPHDKMTANLSTLVITSHINDGVELATVYKLPQVIKDIIRQHHGTTLVTYFYHKALNIEKCKDVDPNNFRYEGPKPLSREAAVVMLADSVEAAVRSMQDKTKGKIEGLVRKIIKDKLDDGQLDMCDLTLKDLNETAEAFMRVLNGIFHERQQYPEVNIRSSVLENPESIEEKAMEKMHQ